MVLNSFILISLLILIQCGFSTCADIPEFGGCQPENQTCTECYHTLRVSLLKSDRNIRNLFNAFYPPRSDLPEFVYVTYCFNDNCLKNKTWYWSHESSYLFLPLQTFEFLTLYFSKPMIYITQKLTLYLDEECYEADNKMFNLLTQRLKNFIQKASFDPSIDDNYFARAEGDKQDFLQDEPSNSTAKFIVPFYGAGLGTAVLITFLLLIVHCYSNGWYTKLRNVANTVIANKSTQSKIFSVAATAFFVNVYTLVLSSIALANTINNDGIIKDRYVNVLPYIIFGVDALGIIIWFICWIISLLCSIYTYAIGQDRGHEYFFLALSIFGPILSFTVHIPYVTIAYLNDGTYATSILIFYLITILVVFGTLNSTYGNCLSCFINRRDMANQENVRLTMCLCCVNHACIPHAIVILILFFAGIIAAMLMIVPITKAFSDAPSRLQTFYQTAAIVVGVYLVYWKFYKKQPSIDLVIGERKGRFQNQTQLQLIQWDTLSKDEKMKQFYSNFIDIIMNYIQLHGENQKLRAAKELLLVANEQLREVHKRLTAANQSVEIIKQLQKANEYLQDANKQLQMANQYLQGAVIPQLAGNWQMQAGNWQLQAASEQLLAADLQLQVVKQVEGANIISLINNQLQAVNQQQQEANSQLQAAKKQQQAASQMLQDANVQQHTANNSLQLANDALHTANNMLHTANIQLKTTNQEVSAMILSLTIQLGGAEEHK